MIIYEPTTTYTRKSVKGERLENPEAVYKYVKNYYDLSIHMYDPTKEHFGVIVFNRKNFPLMTKIISTGGITSTVVDMRVLFREVYINNGTAFTIFHNHPSGDPQPSAQDIRITRTIREATRVLELDLIDHIVAGEAENDPCGRGYYSFREAGIV